MIVLAAALVTAAVAGCSAGPSDRPTIAVRSDAPASPSPSPSPAAVPPLQAPVTDLTWRSCSSTWLQQTSPAPLPAGVTLECATLTAPVDDQLPDSLSLGLVRARTADTPREAAPVVLTTGADEPSGTALARWARADGAALLAQHPVVALDRRGLGTSDPVSCLSAAQRTDITTVDASGPDPSALDTIQQLGRTSTQSCTDVLSPAELGYDAAHAAGDLEVLRTAWKVDRLALLGLGDGAAVALRYSIAHPDHVSRLVLDSPASYGADAATMAKEQATGAEAALRAFSTQCAATQCPAGPDATATVLDVLNQARARNGLPAAGGSLAAGAIPGLLARALSSPDGARALPAALERARAGDGTALAQLGSTGAPPGQVDAELVARCSDVALRPSAEQVSTLLAQWRTEMPVFGADAAARLLLCLSWPTPATAPQVRELGAVPPVLVLAPAADPVAGPSGAPAAVTSVQQAGSDATLVRWQGYGHPVLPASACARTAVAAYLADGTRPQAGTICPA